MRAVLSRLRFWVLAACCLVAVWQSARVAHAQAPAEEYANQLRHLQGADNDRARDAAEWFAKLPLDRARQAEVSAALNGLDREAVRTAAIEPLAVWGTEQNVPLLANLLSHETFDRKALLELARKIGDARLIEPLIVVLAEPFDDGQLAEQILTQWKAEADPLIVKHMNHPSDEAHDRLARIIEARRIEGDLLAQQATRDLSSQNPEQRGYAARWLSEAKSLPKPLHPELAAAAIKLLGDKSGSLRESAIEIVASCADKSHDEALLKLLSSGSPFEWHAGLRGVIRTGNVKGAAVLAERMSDVKFAGPACRIMNGAGPPAEDLAIAILRQPLEGKGQAHISIALTIGEVGGRKSLAALTQFERKQGRALKTKFPSVAGAVDAAKLQIGGRPKPRD